MLPRYHSAMAEDEQPDERTERAWPMAAALFLLLISPVGAPIVGLVIIYGCDIQWEGAYQCVIPTPLIDYFLTFIFLPWALGPVLAILWTLASLGVLLGFLYFAAKAIWQIVTWRR